MSFSFNIDIDSTSVDISTFVVRNIYNNNKDSVVVAGTRVVNGKTITFIPGALYKDGSTLHVVLDGIKSIDDVTMDKKVFTFLVAGPIVYAKVIRNYPANNAINVAVGDSIVFTVNESIVSASTIIKVNGNSFNHSKVIDGKTITLSHANFPSDANIEALLFNVVSDSGHTLASIFKIQFKVEHIDYVILETNPNNGAVNVLSESNITAKVSEPFTSMDVEIEVNGESFTNYSTVISNDSLIIDPDVGFLSDSHVKIIYSNAVTSSGNTFNQPIVIEFDVEHIDMFPVPKGFFTNAVYVDQDGKIYFVGDSLLRYLPSGKLDKTAPFGFTSDVVVTDNGNVYIAADAGIIELDNDLNYLNTYNTPGVGRLVVAGNSVYMVSYNNTTYISNVMTGVLRETGWRMSHGIIFDPDYNQIIINGESENLLRTSAYTLDLEIVWQKSFKVDGFSPLVYALVKNQAGNYLSFGHFINYSVMRLEYSPTGVPLDTVDIGRFTIFDAEPSPVHDIIVVRKDLNFGDRVAVDAINKRYIAAQVRKVRFFKMNDTKDEITELRRP